jgi:raffinose/stachyose/melibiose transport system substrate-binding protein
MDLTDELNGDPDWKNTYLKSVMPGVTFDGKVYGVPYNKIQPVTFNYNKRIFEKYHLSPPKTWQDLLDIVKTLRKHNVIPISLAGKNAWTELMFEEYLVDRIGGPQVFKDVLSGKEKAWSNPAFIKANTMIQQLVDAGAFEQGFSSVGYGSGAANALVYTDKAAMILMGSWNYASILSDKPDFINNGYLGWFAFPAVEGGSGDPRNIAGNLSNYYSVTKDSKHKDAAVQYLKDAVLNKKAVEGYISLGEVPPAKNIGSQLKDSKYSDWLTFNHELVKSAPNFQLSWDQALPPKEATQLLDDLSKLFLKEMTPQQFSKDMNQYLKK